MAMEDSSMMSPADIAALTRGGFRCLFKNKSASGRGSYVPRPNAPIL